jgi:hypothetical protein
MQLEKMIEAGTMNAEIDQLEKLILFLIRETEKQKRLIGEFCVNHWTF